MKLFVTTLVGSTPRSKELLRASRQLKKNKITQSEYDEMIFNETKDWVNIQEKAGIDIITSGELARDNYLSFIAEKIHGLQYMSNIDMLEFVKDKHAYEEMLDIMDVPGSSIKNAICTERLQDSGDIVLNELRMLKKITNKPIKITMPGPYLVTRSAWLSQLSGKVYSSKTELGKDVINIMKAEIKRLLAEGVDIIQFDEPVLTEVVFMEGKTRTFMCASLSEKKDPTEELEFAKSLLEPVISAVDHPNTKSSLHVCRGNWSNDESILLTGPYTPLIELFDFVKPDMLTLEFSTPRAGELDAFLSDSKMKNITMGLGVVNPRTQTVETIEEIISKVDIALKYLPPENILINPDCGFGTFASRPINELKYVKEKLIVLVEAAKRLQNR